MIAQPPHGTLTPRPRSWNPTDWERSDEEEASLPAAVRGYVYGPLTFPLMLEALAEVAAQKLPTVLIACGGIHAWEHVRQALDAGAAAVQVDSAVWVEPGLPNQLVQAWLGQTGAGA